ncbi:hypothetical protein DFS34DRAFT_505382 [Phlyctochytrium arcticum]|nr:hypothetical protein DFS34DRAFT_505382 [Phlyctochytrium arcticum]
MDPSDPTIHSYRPPLWSRPVAKYSSKLPKMPSIVAAAATLPVLFFTSPFALTILLGFYLMLILTVGAYASYVTFRDFFWDEVFSSDGQARIEHGRRGFLEKVLGLDQIQSQEKDHPVDSELSAPLLPYWGLENLFLGPAVVMYLTTRACTATILLALKHLTLSTVHYAPIIISQLFRGMQATLRFTANAWNTVGIVIWNHLSTPIREVAITIYRANIAIVHFIHDVVDAATQAVIPVLIELVVRTIELSYQTGAYVWKAVCHIALAVKIWSVDPLIEFMKWSYRQFATYIWPIMQQVLDYTSRLATRVSEFTKATVAPIVYTIISQVSAAIQHIARLGWNVTNSIYTQCTRLAATYLVPPLRIVANKTFVIIQRTAQIAKHYCILLLTTTWASSYRAIAQLHRRLQAIGAYSFLFFTLPRRTIRALDKTCDIAEIAISAAVVQLIHLTGRVHTLAAPLFRILWKNGLEVVVRQSGVLIVYVNRMGGRYVAAFVLAAVHSATQVALLVDIELRKAINRSQFVATELSARVGRLASSTPKKL